MSDRAFDRALMLTLLRAAPRRERVSGRYPVDLEVTIETIRFDEHVSILALSSPKRSCKRCQGRGYDGVRVDIPGKRLYNVCRCVGPWKAVRA